MKGAREILRGAVLALLIAAIAAPSAQGELGFSPPQTLFSGVVGSPRIAVDSQGRATVVSLDSRGPGEGTLVQMSRLSPTGLPEPIRTLGEIPPASSLGRCVCPQIAMGPLDRAVVAWQTVVEGRLGIAAVSIAPDGEPGPAQILSPAGENAGNPRIAANGEGLFAVAWEVDGEDRRIEAAVSDSEGTFAEPHLLNDPGDGGTFPHLAASPDGSFRVAWNQAAAVYTTMLDEEGTQGSAEPVSPEDETAFLTGLVVDSEGRATIAWSRPEGHFEAKVVRLDQAGVPGPIRTLHPSDQNVDPFAIAIDGQDRVTAVWADFESRVFAVRVGADGIPGEPHQISPGGHLAGLPVLATAPDGRVVVAWTHPPRFFIPEESCGVTELEPDDDVVRTALLGSDGALEGVYDVSAHGEEAASVEVALNPLGLPWFVWETYDGTYFCEDVSGRIQFSRAFETQDPSDEGPVAAPPAPPAPARNVPMLLLAKRGTADQGRVRIRVRCSGQPGGSCRGSIRLLTPTGALPPGRATALRKRPITLARGRYGVAAGSAETLELVIPEATRRLIAARQPRRLASIVRGRGLSTKTVLIRVIAPNP